MVNLPIRILATLIRMSLMDRHKHDIISKITEKTKRLSTGLGMWFNGRVPAWHKQGPQFNAQLWEGEKGMVR